MWMTRTASESVFMLVQLYDDYRVPTVTFGLIVDMQIPGAESSFLSTVSRMCGVGVIYGNRS
jgi:hypothetical protein